jgi:ubiquinone/menaquinone biosynthesis C-methylase UbiE/DNA-binding transcriptional ArsR family regulator
MDELLASLKAAAESTRIRIMFILSHGELNVSELTYVLGQSQPRVSRHLKLMSESGLLSRHKEGNWVLFRLRDEGLGGALARALVDMLSVKDNLLSGDLARLEAVKRQREEKAAAYFSANAPGWSQLRSLHVDEQQVEQTMHQLVGAGPLGTVVDLGTGTGRILELFADRATRLQGIDSSRDMLAIARATLERQKQRHPELRQAELRQADIFALPLADASADVVTIHQVLHFLDEPLKALLEARRILKPDGKLLVVDFAPHELEQLRDQHAHRRLGISAEQMAAWFGRANLSLDSHNILPPPWRKDGAGLTVSLWLARPVATTTPAHFRTRVNT